MQRACSRCGQVTSEPEARFCGSCGGPLAVLGAAGSTATSGPGAALEGARCAAHPDTPALAVCSRCGAFTCAACVQRDLDGNPLCADCGRRTQAGRWEIPWEKRGELGLVRAYWQTAKQAAFEPERAFSGMNPHGNWWDPVSYAMVSAVLGASGTLLLYAVIGAGIGLFATHDLFQNLHGSAAAAAVVGIAVAALVVFVVLIVVGTLLRVYVGAGVDHLSLMLFGSARGGFDATFRSYCYAMSPGVFGLIPGCGSYIFEIWRLVISIIAYKTVHKTTGIRATLAAVIPLAVCFGGYVALVAGAQIFAATQS